MEYGIYNIESGNLVNSAVRLLEKIYNSGKRCVFFSPLAERVNLIDRTLWTFSTNVFVPHGDKNLGFSEKQPIFFTDTLNVNPNGATVLMMLDSLDFRSWNDYEKFEKIIMMFDDEESRRASEKLFADLKKGAENVNYWKQSSKGWIQLENID